MKKSETVELIIKARNEAGQALTQAERMIKSVRDTVESAKLAFKGYLAVLVTQRLLEFASSTYKIGEATKGLTRGMTVAAGSIEAATTEMEFARQTAIALDLDIQATTSSYMSLTAATQGTALAGKPTREIFLSVAQAAAVLGKSADDTAAMLLALEQMVSKNTVSAEELRGQLGERLPGAYRLAADAMGMTTAELDKQLTLGKITAEELLPKLAAALTEKYGKAAQEADKATGELSNSWFELKRAIGDAGFVTVVEGLIKQAAQTTMFWAQAIRGLIGETDRLGYATREQAQGRLDEVSSRIQQLERMVNASYVDQYQNPVAARLSMGGLQPSETADDARAWKKELADLEAERKRLEGLLRSQFAWLKTIGEGGSTAGAGVGGTGTLGKLTGDGGGGGGGSLANSLEQALQARIQSVLTRANALAETELAKLKDLYDRGTVSLQEYFDRRKEMLEDQYQTEITAIQQKIAVEKDAAGQIRLQDDLFATQQAHQRELLSLAIQRAEAEKQVTEARARIDDMLRTAGIENMDTSTAAGQAAQELARFQQAWDDRLKALVDAKATEDQWLEYYHQRELARQKLEAEQQTRLLEDRLATAVQVAGGMGQAFQSLYDLTGKETKTFFYFAKAAAIAEATMNVYQGVTKALAQGGFYGYAMAAIVAAQGAVALGKIYAQNLAVGGMVQGWSPTKTADNIPANLTAGEYVLQVDAVRKYGLGFVEALNRQLIPTDMVAGLRLPSLPIHRPAHAFATGGLATTGRTEGKQEFKAETTIINVMDARELDQYLASKRGQDAILNVLSSRAGAVRKITR